MFEKLYSTLNPEQKKAVDTIDGPVMVIAGPGTGKTSILTLRIANILKRTDTAPENILALTFTESGAHAMRKKLADLIGIGAYRVNIHTFHGFCNDIIREYPEKFPRIIGATPIADIDQIALMEEIILGTAAELAEKEAKISILKPYGDPLYYIRPVLGTIRDLKREGVSADEFDALVKKQEKDFENIPDLIHEKGAYKGKMKGEYVKLKEQIAKNKELAVLYHQYQKVLQARRYYDYEDMIMEVVAVLKADPDFLLMLQETYQYILADEHQDANNSQNAVLELLSGFHEHPNLFIVGDEKQAIFRFQGASLENFLYFKKLYPEAVLINLESNYRSQQHILDSAHHLIGHNRAAISSIGERIQLRAKAIHKEEQINVFECGSTAQEMAFLVQDISGRLKNNKADGKNSEKVLPQEIAILYRNNSDAFPIADALSRAGIPHRIESDQDITADEYIQKLIFLLRAVNNPSDNNALGKALFIDTLKVKDERLKTVEVFNLLNKTYKERRPLYEMLGEEYPELYEHINHWASVARNKGFLEFFEMLVRDSGYLRTILETDQSVERLHTLEAFFVELKKIAGTRQQYYLADFITYLDRAKNHHIFIKSSVQTEKNAVRLMTAHKSKGLEFEYVYITGAYEGHWGNTRQKTTFKLPALSARGAAAAAGVGGAGGKTKAEVNEESGAVGGEENRMEDERRLFYVALTRAKKSVSISYATENTEGRQQLPSQFISELDPKLVKMHTAAEVATKYPVPSGFAFTEPQHTPSPITDPEYIKQLFYDQGLSVTGLNNYIQCPWNYFFMNLIRLPQIQTKHQMYGTAVHQTLRMFFNKFREEADMSKEELLTLFEHNLSKQALFGDDFDSSLEKGKRALGGYYDTYKSSWKRNLLTEFGIKKVMFGEIPLTGQLDKIEFLTTTDVNVVDYKTGSPKSRNEIEGKTKSSNGNYKRQLTFYKLLLDLEESRKLKMVSAELDFIEPDDKGRYHKEKFEITDEDTDELKKAILKVTDEITNLAFMTGKCNEKDCEYCDLSILLKRGGNR